ncbi:hypothetical protein [Chitinibacter sp. GC72]|uniref:DUF6950 family protein n=1 Tax=Chitinibacter sp. GC72 TaxID=1526917 RepID=UPI0012F9B543|nr:hypothetical protein [Chitinibacter sp. GC72]
MRAEFTQRLCDFAEAQIGKPYRRPDTVCMALALQGIDFAAATDFYGPHRQHFKSAASLQRFIGATGLDGLITYMAQQGFDEIPVSQLAAGDIGFTGQGALGIGAALLVGRRALTSHPDTGVALYPVPSLSFVRAVRLTRRDLCQQ